MKSKRIANPRQVILDYINSHPDSLCDDVLEVVPYYEKKTMIRAMSEMEAMGELTRRRDKALNGSPYRYTAIKTIAGKPMSTYVKKHEREAMPGEIDKFDKAAVVRQLILDYANKHGRVTSRDLVEAKIVDNSDHANRSCRKMQSVGELEAHGKGTGLYFTPLMEETMSASEMRQRALHQHQKGIDMDQEKRRLIKVSPKEPWRYVHQVREDGKPIPNQEGIGSGRSRIYANSSCSMI